MENTQDARVDIRIPSDLKAKLAVYCKRERTTASDVIRMLVEELLEKGEVDHVDSTR